MQQKINGIIEVDLSSVNSIAYFFALFRRRQQAG